jgi:hypothetical protein
MELRPSPLSWGKTNHIQWLLFMPRRSSPEAISHMVALSPRTLRAAWAWRKRCRSGPSPGGGLPARWILLMSFSLVDACGD